MEHRKFKKAVMNIFPVVQKHCELNTEAVFVLFALLSTLLKAQKKDINQARIDLFAVINSHVFDEIYNSLEVGVDDE
jgi:hypothetical protein